MHELGCTIIMKFLSVALGRQQKYWQTAQGLSAFEPVLQLVVMLTENSSQCQKQ